MESKEVFDLGIIGAGMVGACAAWLARKEHPDWNIALIDRSLAGHGTSLYSASLDVPYGHTPLRKALVSRSRRLFTDLKTAIPSLPEGPVKVYGFVEAREASRLLSRIADPDVRPGTEEEMTLLKRKYTGLTIPRNSALLTGITGRRALHNTVAIGIAQAFASTRDTMLFEGMEIREVEREKALYRLKPPHGSSIRAKRVIQATGPWMMSGPGSEQAEKAGIRIKKVAAFHIRSRPEPDAAVLYFFDDDAFLMPRHEAGQWLLSIRSDQWDVAPEIGKLTLDEEDWIKAQTLLQKYYPEFLGRLCGGRAFCDGYTPNGDPVVMKAFGQETYVMAGACAGSGYRLGPAIAERALQLLDPTKSIQALYEEKSTP